MHITYIYNECALQIELKYSNSVFYLLQRPVDISLNGGAYANINCIGADCIFWHKVGKIRVRLQK